MPCLWTYSEPRSCFRSCQAVLPEVRQSSKLTYSYTGVSYTATYSYTAVFGRAKDSKTVRDAIQAPFTMTEFLTAIDKAKLRAVPGPDGVTYGVFKSIHCLGPQFLLNWLNTTWACGNIPLTLKHAKVVPIPKTGKPPEWLSNIRPIALTSTHFKLLERMLTTRIS